jgi:putative ABC transport system ATP-binding protein
VLARLRDVQKVFVRGARRVVALDGVSLEIAEGEWLAVMGPSGSGKSTLLAILGCLERPTSGEYLLDGTPVQGLTDAALSRVRNERIGFVFQAFHLIPELSVVENVATPLLYRGLDEAESQRRARAALEQVLLLSRAEHRPAELSGGEAQRAAIARALVGQPRVVLADEPTGNLDSVTGGQILALLEDVHRSGRTVVLVTHNEALASRAGRVVWLEDGRLADRTHA